MEDKAKIYLFEEAPLHSTIFKLAVPTVLSSLVMVIYNLADTYFVGMLNNPVQNAAVTLSAPVLLAFNAVNNLFGVGSSSLMSRCLGAKEYDNVKRVSAFGFYCSLFFGLLFSLIFICTKNQMLVVLGTDSSTFEVTAQYLKWTVGCGAAPAIINVVMAYLIRSEGASLHASIGTMSGCLLNIVLDPIFIMPWGLNMGASGAGCATFISNCVACLYFFTLLFVKRKNTYVCVNPKYFGLKKWIVIGVCAVGIPASIQNLLNVTGMTILNNFTSAFGADAVAAMGIVYKINMVPVYVAMGVGQGIMPLISYNYAAKNYRRMKDTILFSLKAVVALMAAAMVFFYVSAGFITRIFMDNEVIVAYGIRFFHGFCLALPFLSIDYLIVGVFQATGMGRNSLIFAILRKIVLEIPALVILNHLFPLYGLTYAQTAAEVILSVVAVAVLWRMFVKLNE